MAKTSPSTFTLLARLPGQIARIISAETANAKAEVSGRVRNLIIGVVLFVAALIIIFWSTAVLLAAAVAGLAEAVPVWLSALIIGGAGVLTVVILVIAGIALLKKGNPVPNQTISRIKDDIQAAQNLKTTTDKMRTQPGKPGTEPGNSGVWE